MVLRAGPVAVREEDDDVRPVDTRTPLHPLCSGFGERGVVHEVDLHIIEESDWIPRQRGGLGVFSERQRKVVLQVLNKAEK